MYDTFLWRSRSEWRHVVRSLSWMSWAASASEHWGDPWRTWCMAATKLSTGFVSWLLRRRSPPRATAVSSFDSTAAVDAADDEDGTFIRWAGGEVEEAGTLFTRRNWAGDEVPDLAEPVVERPLRLPPSPLLLPLPRGWCRWWWWWWSPSSSAGLGTECWLVGVNWPPFTKKRNEWK